MPTNKGVTLAAKCAPDEEILANIEKSGISAVEIYTDSGWLQKIDKIKHIPKKFPFRYAVHAPNDCYEPEILAEFVNETKAEVLVFHDIYWDDEWDNIANIFKETTVQICIENTHSTLEPLKFMRRYGFGICLDLEHLQQQCAGIFEKASLPFIRQVSHVHLTGYSFGSNQWHTHIHHSPEHGFYLLDLLRKAGYSGFVVSEATPSFQTLSEFKKLFKFFKEWENSFLCSIKN